MIRSLRLQLFLGILVILLGAGGIVMVLTQQGVEEALIDAEDRSARNVLSLIELNVSTRYRELLMEKVRIVGERRARLQQLGEMIGATMNSFDGLVGDGTLSRPDARDMALAWTSRLQLGPTATAFAMTPGGRIEAHPVGGFVGRDIGALEDMKGRPLIRAIAEDIDAFGHAFVVYEDPEDAGPDGDGRRFAYFVPVPAFNLYMGISDQIGDVEDYVQVGVAATIDVLDETLGQVRVVDTGFVFIFDSDLAPITAPPDWASGLLAPGAAGASPPILDSFRQATLRDDGQAVHYTLDVDGAPRKMEAHVSFFRPLGWFIVSTMPSAEVAAPAVALVQRQVVIFGAVLGASLLLAWIFATRITRPLLRLTAYARALPTQDFTREAADGAALKTLGRTRSEVGRLAGAFMFMERTLRDNIRALLDTTRAKERIESELSIAQEIQRGLLPKIFPPFPKCREIDLHAAVYPARHVGGDLFDFYFLDDHRLLFTVGDVADKGVPSALFMAITKTLVKAVSSQETEPALMMERVNNDLSADNPSAMFVTLLIGILDIRTGRIDYVNAGQNPPLVVSRATATARFLRDISGPPAGSMPQMTYRPLSVTLEPGDMMIVYSDGITEAMNPDKTEYGNERLQQMAQGWAAQGAAAVVEAVVDDVRRHSGGEDQSDDITILCLGWHDDPPSDDPPSNDPHVLTKDIRVPAPGQTD